MVPSMSNNSIFDDVIKSLGAVYALLKIQLASEEACVNNTAGVWEDIADFTDDIVQRTMIRILKAVTFAIRPHVVLATPDFSTMPLGAGILAAFPVLSKFFGEASRTGARMLEMFNRKIQSMESRNQAKFLSGDRLLEKINRMNALAKAINFVGELIGIREEVSIDEEAIISHVQDITNRYAEQSFVNTLATDPGALTSEEVARVMGTVSYTESMMAKAESGSNTGSTRGITFYGPDGKPLTPSGVVSIDKTKLPGYDSAEDAMWETVISVHGEGSAGRVGDDEYTARFWGRHGFPNSDEVAELVGESALGPHKFKITGRLDDNTSGNTDTIAQDDEETTESSSSTGDPESGIKDVARQLDANLGEFVGDIIDVVDAEGASEELADELEASDSQAQEANKNTKVIRIIEGLKA